MTDVPGRSKRSSGSVAALILGWIGFGSLLLAACELGARVDDWFFSDTAVLANPSYDELFITDEEGIRRGRPGAHWKKVALNNLGLRGPDVPPLPRSECRRWLFLGASETFGEPTLADMDYPAVLRVLESQQGCTDILNSAFPGIAPQELLRYYQPALSQHRPDRVFIYASTHFYLAEMSARDEPWDKVAEEQPRPQSAQAGSGGFSVASVLKKSRFLERLRDSAEVPPLIQKWRMHRWISSAVAGQPADWGFKAVPQRRLDYLADDLRELIGAIRSSGAEPVLMTHAVRVANPPTPDDRQDLFAMRVYVPRASEEVIADFEYAAAERVRRLGAETGVQVIDVARALSGQRDKFIDLVHFSPQGHEAVAQLIHDQMRGLTASAANEHAVQ